MYRALWISAALIGVVATFFILYLLPQSFYEFTREAFGTSCDPNDESCDNMSTFLPSYAVLFVELGIVTTVLFTVVIVIAPSSARPRLSKDFRLVAALMTALCTLPLATYTLAAIGSLEGLIGLLSFALYSPMVICLFVSLDDRSSRFTLAVCSAMIVAIVANSAVGGVLFVVAGTLVVYPLAAILALLLPARRGATTPATPAL